MPIHSIRNSILPDTLERKARCRFWNYCADSQIAIMRSPQIIVWRTGWLLRYGKEPFKNIYWSAPLCMRFHFYIGQSGVKQTRCLEVFFTDSIKKFKLKCFFRISGFIVRIFFISVANTVHNWSMSHSIKLIIEKCVRGHP